MTTSDDGTIVLEHGSLRFTTHTAGRELPDSAPVVICLHGFPDDAGSFRHQLPALAAAGYRAYAPTLRGYEPSSQPPTNDYSFDALTSDVLAWIDQLGVDQVDLLGHDWGAMVAQLVARRAPRRFRSLTTVAVPHLAGFFASVPHVPRQLLNSWYIAFFQLPFVPERVLPRDDWALIRRLWADWSPGYTLAPADWARLRETFAAPGVAKVMLAYYRQNLSLGLLPYLRADARAVPVRTMAVTGADDGCVDTRVFDHAIDEADFPAGVRVERIARAGHFVHQERPEAFNELLLDWLG